MKRKWNGMKRKWRKTEIKMKLRVERETWRKIDGLK